MTPLQPYRIRIQNRSGQMLIISVLLLFVLMIVVPALVYYSRTGTLHGVFSLKRSRGRTIAEEGLALGLQKLTQPNNWPYFVGGGLPSKGTVQSPDGQAFALSFTSTTAGTARGLQRYQVGVLARALDAKGQPIGGGSVIAHVSQRTTGVKLPTGLAASAALELGAVPLDPNTANLRVEFGPIVIRDTSTWNLDNTNATLVRRPRKFSAGGIWPRNTSPFGRTTDNKEYWTYITPGFTTVFDNAFYINQAQASACPALASCPGCTNAAANPPNSCNFPGVGPGTAVLNNFTSTTPGGSVYINGNADFQNVTLNKSSAVFVTGNLNLGVNGKPASGWAVKNVRIPPTVALEDPYCTCCDMLCMGQVDRNIDLRGLIYVGGNATVTQDTNWTVIGVMRVDGTLNLGTNSSVYLFYDDLIGHDIRTSNFEVQIDSMTAIP